MTVNATLRGALAATADASRLSERMMVDFAVDEGTRTNDSRDAMMQYAFGEGHEASAAASTIAMRLADAMDMRSHACLLVCAAYRDGGNRRITLWTFPKDEAFRLRRRASGSAIDYLQDVFSRNSKLRKAAMFEGQRRRTDFLGGRVLDYQTASTSQEVADFWIQRFLQCVPAIAADAGTRLLARAIKQAIGKCAELPEQEQILAGLMAVRRSPQRRWSLSQFADQFLDGAARAHFRSTVNNEATWETSFNVQRDVLDSALQFSVYQLDNGVWVSSPLDQIGEAVRISDRRGEKHLACEGTVVSEKVRSRHA